jgi:hypothetical protein
MGWIALTLVAVAALLFARRPEMFLHPQFWAEDGSIFFVQADAVGWRALTEPSGGYHHLLLRLVAAAATPLPALYIPGAYFVACLGLTLALAAALFSPRIELQGRTACALAIALIPHTGEVIGNLTNLQWITALGLVWLLVAQPATTHRQLATDAVIAGVLGLTGVFSILLAPLFILRAVWQRSRGTLVVAIIVVIAAAIQAAAVLKAASTPGASSDTWLTPIAIVGHRLAAGLLLPAGPADRLPTGVMTALGALTLAALLAAALWPGPRRPMRFLLGAAIVVIVAGTLFRLRPDLWQLDRMSQGDRYFFLPKLLAAWLLIQAAVLPGWRRIVGLAGCAAALAASAGGWRYERIRNLDWPQYARQLDAGGPVNGIPINPEGTFSHPGRH